MRFSDNIEYNISRPKSSAVKINYYLDCNDRRYIWNNNKRIRKCRLYSLPRIVDCHPEEFYFGLPSSSRRQALDIRWRCTTGSHPFLPWPPSWLDSSVPRFLTLHQKQFSKMSGQLPAPTLVGTMQPNAMTFNRIQRINACSSVPYFWTQCNLERFSWTKSCSHSFRLMSMIVIAVPRAHAHRHTHSHAHTVCTVCTDEWVRVCHTPTHTHTHTHLLTLTHTQV